MSLKTALKQHKTFTIVFDRTHVLDFQTRFWNLMQLCENLEVPWFNGLPANDHGMCWSLLGQVWKVDPTQVMITFETKARWTRAYDEEEDKMIEFMDDVYGFTYNIEEPRGTVYQATELDKDETPSLDLTQLLRKW